MIVEREIGGRRLRAECSPEHARRAESVLAVFARLAGQGSPPRPGLTIRFGGSLLRLTDEGEALRVEEPDFAVWPEERFSPTIEITLDVLAAQTSLLHLLDVDGEDAYFDQVLLAAPGALEEPEVFLRREESHTAEDSGWLLGTVADPEALTRGDGLAAVPIASLVGRRPILLAALALPPGFLVLLAGDSITQILDAAGRERLPPAA